MKSVLFKHRSIRKFRPTPIPEEVLRECLEAASRASTCGNMQLYSLVVTAMKRSANGSRRAISTSRWSARLRAW